MKDDYGYKGPFYLNCFLFIIPVLVWNIIFRWSLPEAYSNDFFWNEIPGIVSKPENMLRIVVFILPLIMSISFKEVIQKIGLLIYILGIAVYFGSWIMQIYYTESVWSNSIWGFMAPAYTPVIWFIGIGFIGKYPFVRIPFFRIFYFSLISLFILFHTIHTYIIFIRL